MQLNIRDKNERQGSHLREREIQAEFCRFYFIPFAQDETCICGFCEETGGRSESKTCEEIHSSLIRAQEGQYQAVIFPCYLLNHANPFEYVKKAHSLGLEVILQISAKNWSPELQRKLRAFANQGVLLNVMLGHPGPNEELLIQLSRDQAQYSYYTLVGIHLRKIPKYVASLPQYVLNSLHFYFPLDPIETKRMFLTPEINQTLRKTVQKVRRAGKSLKVRGPKGVDVFEPHIPNDRDLEPFLSPGIESKTATSSEMEVSIVIPTYNSRDYIKNVIRHLFKQKLDATKYEVIVVDDGSDDGTQEELLKFIAPFQGLRNFKYIFFSRLTPRKRGDSQFRAGIARNVGVKNSSGRLLLFLDSDMLLPPHYLTDLIDKMKTYDVVQGKRLFLNEDVSNELTSYQLIDTELDTYPEDPYWASFQSTEDWNKLHNHWKYVCTHSLAVKADAFKRLGWFRKTFLYYGFEDVDLGYRLARDGARFLLNDVPVYHLHPPPSQSEYNRSPARRQIILSKTCRIFFHHSLDEAAFQDFRGLLAPSENMKLDLPAINTKNTLFWFSHFYHAFRWRLMWFLFHPAPKATVRLTGGLARRTVQWTYWRLLWPMGCWTLWRVKAISNWLYWRAYGLINFFRWRVLVMTYWKVIYPTATWAYYQVGVRTAVFLYWRVIMFSYHKIWRPICGLTWRIYGLLGRAYGLLCRFYGLLCRAKGQLDIFYGKVMIPAGWLLFKMTLPVRKPFHMISYQYRKRILHQPPEELESH